VPPPRHHRHQWRRHLLGANGTRTERLADHVDYVAGWSGRAMSDRLDYAFEVESAGLDALLAARPDTGPRATPTIRRPGHCGAGQLPELADAAPHRRRWLGVRAPRLSAGRARAVEHLIAVSPWARDR